MPQLVDAQTVVRVDLLRVALDGWSYWDERIAVPGETFASVVDAQAKRIVDLLHALPDGEQMRCFIPTYGLRILSGDGMLAETAICFRCNNALTLIAGEKGWFKFDAESEPAARLLAEFRRHDPSPSVA